LIEDGKRGQGCVFHFMYEGVFTFGSVRGFRPGCCDTVIPHLKREKKKIELLLSCNF
jgi:hypothetical protein